jgi:ubiquinol-cytochrome c reductase cytochrome c subunit
MQAGMKLVLALAALALLAAAPAAAAPGSSVQRGKQLYGQYCVMCHGAGGSGIQEPRPIGSGPYRAQGEHSGFGPSLRGVGALAADFYLRTGYMPLQHIRLQPRRSRVLFSERQIRALISYVASLGPGPGIPKPRPENGNLGRGMHLFMDHCAGCHQIVAEGGYLTGAVAPPLEDATSAQIAEAVRIGPYVMPRFSKKSISDADLNSIIAYVQYAKHPDDRGGWSLGHIGPVPEGLVTWFLAAVALIGVCIVIGKRLKGGEAA